jgi:hypothetical protein
MLLLAGVLGLVACDEAGPYGHHTLYRLTAEHAPASAELAGAYGLDLNGDSTHDNQLGSALGIMMYYGLGDVQNATDQAVAAHTVELVVDVQYDGRGDSVVNTFVGSADAYDPTAPMQTPIEGTNDGPYVKASGSDMPIVIAPFGVATPVVLHDAHVELFAGPASLTAIIGGGLDPEFATGTLMMQWRDVVQAIVDRDCSRMAPDCNCLTGTPGETAISYFDPDRDCTITLDELANGYIVPGVLDPDMKVDGEPMLSFGFGIDAERLPD